MPNDILKTFKNWPVFEQRFKSNISKECFLSENKDNCWEWQGYKKKQGYGEITWGKSNYLAHRVSYFIFNGNIPKDQEIRHTCDNPSCVNPAHLILGSHANNMSDMTKRNRQWKQKLNKEAVKVIKWMLKYKPKRGLAAKLAKLHKVSYVTISYIKAGRIWGHIHV